MALPITILTLLVLFVIAIVLPRNNCKIGPDLPREGLFRRRLALALGVLTLPISVVLENRRAKNAYLRFRTACFFVELEDQCWLI